MKHRRLVAVALAAATAVAVTGCGGDSGSDKQQQTSKQLSTQSEFNQQPYDQLKDGGTVTTAVAEITPQFNTFQSDGTLYTLLFWRWYNPQLMLFDPDGTAHPDPDYLSGYETVVKGGKTVVTYTINPKATYNDGILEVRVPAPKEVERPTAKIAVTRG